MSTVRKYTLLLLLMGALIGTNAAGCSDSSVPGGGVDSGIPDWGVTKCGPGLLARGPACVPVFDYCKAGEVSLLGGGCKRVGPPTKCLAGWEVVKGGWCEPIRPQISCPKGSMMIIGNSSCQPIRDCGSGKYGNIKTTAKTIHVDRQYARADSDGTKGKPYQSIDDALSAAPSGAHIAVAAGEYLENLTINKPVTLEGRCPRMVTVKGYKTDRPATIQVTAAKTTIKGLSVTGVKVGVDIAFANEVTVDGCSIRDNAEIGLAATEKSGITIRRTLVVRNRGMGVQVGVSSAATLEACVVRETREKYFVKDKVWAGWGIWVHDRSEVSIKNSIVSSNRHHGIKIIKSKGTVTGCEISETWDRQQEKKAVPGVGLYDGATATIRHSLIKDNRGIGLVVLNATAVLESTVIHGTLPRRYDQGWGIGIYVASMEADTQGKLTLRDSLISRSPYLGIYLLNGGQATIERSVIRDTGIPAGGATGAYGIWAFTYPLEHNPRPRATTVEISYSVVEGGRYGGVQTS